MRCSPFGLGVVRAWRNETDVLRRLVKPCACACAGGSQIVSFDIGGGGGGPTDLLAASSSSSSSSSGAGGQQGGGQAGGGNLVSGSALLRLGPQRQQCAAQVSVCVCVCVCIASHLVEPSPANRCALPQGHAKRPRRVPIPGRVRAAHAAFSSPTASASFLLGPDAPCRHERDTVTRLTARSADGRHPLAHCSCGVHMLCVLCPCCACRRA